LQACIKALEAAWRWFRYGTNRTGAYHYRLRAGFDTPAADAAVKALG